IDDYALTATWAAAADDAGFTGLRYFPRFTTGTGRAFTVFGDAGAHPPDGFTITSTTPLADVLAREGIWPRTIAAASAPAAEHDREWLRRCVDLAAEALDAGDEPFGSILVSADGSELFADRNRVAGGDPTQHPEFAIARWAAQHLSPTERAAATVYTSGEHCP